MGKGKDHSGSSIDRAFGTLVGCAQIIGTVIGVIALIVSFLGLFWAITHQETAIQVIGVISGEPTATPVAPADTPMKPTNTPTLRPPTNTPVPKPTDTTISTPVSPTSIPKPTPTYTPYPKPTSTPTPRPILVSLPFEDNFDTGPRAEWQPILGTWRMVDGKYTADQSETWSEALVGDVGWTDYAVDVDVFFHGATGKANPIRIIVRAQGTSYMALTADCLDADWFLISEGESHMIGHKDQAGLNCYHVHDWNQTHLRVEVRDAIYAAYKDGTLLLRVQDNTFTSGRVGLASKYRHENTTRFDNFRVTELH